MPIIDSTGDLIEVIPNSAVFGGQLPKRGKQLVVDRGNGDNGADACAPDGSADKLGLTDAVGRKAGGKVGVFFLGHAGLDNTAAVGRVVPFAGHGLHLLSLIAVSGANLHPITGSNLQGFSKTESPLLYNFCFLRLPDVLGTRFTPAINSCGLSSDGLRRLLSRSDDPEWGVAALCCHRPPGTTRLSRS